MLSSPIAAATMAQFSKGNQAARRRGKGRGTAGRRKKLESAVWWVMDNTLDAKPPSELHRKLQAAYKADDTAFIRDVVKQISRRRTRMREFGAGSAVFPRKSQKGR
jgi:hypothetical protein